MQASAASELLDVELLTALQGQPCLNLLAPSLQVGTRVVHWSSMAAVDRFIGASSGAALRSQECGSAAVGWNSGEDAFPDVVTRISYSSQEYAYLGPFRLSDLM